MNTRAVLYLCIWFLGPLYLSSPGQVVGHVSGEAQSHSLALFLGVMTASFVALLAFARVVHKGELVLHHKHLSYLIIVGSILPSFGGAPFFDDDIYRYVWDGAVVDAGENPYRSLPSQGNKLSLSPEVFSKISFKDVPTVYQPAALSWFALLWSSFGSNVDLWLISFGVMTALTFLLLQQLAILKKVPLSFQSLLFLNPLFLKELSDSAHVDILGVFFLAVAMVVFAQFFSHKSVSYFGLAAAALVKPTILVVAPFIHKEKLLVKLLYGCLVVLVIAAGYFVSFENAGVIGDALSALSHFSANWVFYPGLGELPFLIQSFWGVGDWTLSNRIIQVLSLVFLAIFTALNQMGRVEVSPFWVMFCFLIFQPVVNGWYFVWLIPLALHSRKLLTFDDIELVSWVIFSVILGYVFWFDLVDVTWLRRAAWIMILLWVGIKKRASLRKALLPRGDESNA